jgi:MtN3 and saliva related transmembrane protein
MVPDLQRSEIVGLVAGLGTTFAALPDLIRMSKRRSSRGMNPTMAAILAVFQLVWIYYGVLIDSWPLVAWNIVAVLVNSVTVGAYVRFSRREKNGPRT